MAVQEPGPGSQEHRDGFGEWGELRVPSVEQQSPVLWWDEASGCDGGVTRRKQVGMRTVQHSHPRCAGGTGGQGFPLVRGLQSSNRLLPGLEGGQAAAAMLLGSLGWGCFHHPPHGRRIPSYQQPIPVGMLLESGSSAAASPPLSPLRTQPGHRAGDGLQLSGKVIRMITTAQNY